MPVRDTFLTPFPFRMASNPFTLLERDDPLWGGMRKLSPDPIQTTSTGSTRPASTGPTTHFDPSAGRPAAPSRLG
jgi:hypothetical protein